MIQFSLEEYLRNPRDLVTRNGRKARIICKDKVSKSCPLVVLVTMEDGEEIPFTYHTDGKFYHYENELDLFFAPEKHEGWVNIYEAAIPRQTIGSLVTRYVGSSIWPTEEAAKKAAVADDIVTIKIEWEE